MNRQRGFLLLAVALSGLLGLYVVLPFVEYVLAAVLLAYALHPLHVRLVPRLQPGHVDVNEILIRPTQQEL